MGQLRARLVPNDSTKDNHAAGNITALWGYIANHALLLPVRQLFVVGPVMP